MLIITVKEARKILGRKFAKYSDADIEEMINDLHFISTVALNKLRKELVPKSTVDTGQNIIREDN